MVETFGTMMDQELKTSIFARISVWKSRTPVPVFNHIVFLQPGLANRPSIQIGKGMNFRIQTTDVAKRHQPMIQSPTWR